MSNTITEGKDRELSPDMEGEIVRAPTPAAVDLTAEIAAASTYKEAGQGESMRERSSIESRTGLRVSAVNEARQTSPGRSNTEPLVDQDTARRWADLDASDFGRIRSSARRENAVEAMAGHVRASPEYAEELAKRSPPLADAARNVNEAQDKAEGEARRARDATEYAVSEQRRANLNAAEQSRAALIDAASLATVATIRKRETAQVVELLARSPDTATEQLREAQQSLKAPPLDGRVTAPDDPDIAAQQARAIKRPVAEEQLSQTLLTRFVVSHEKRGVWDKGSTAFTFRSGGDQGRVAFVDAGKALSTERDDKATIRAMVEVATAKNWKEVTVSGTDDFRRNAWLEASLNGLKVRGYEPREADLQILNELQARHRPINTITAVEHAHKRDQPHETAKPVPASQRKHIDGDALTVHEKTVLDNSRAILSSKALSEQFTEAALSELESKLRGERVYVGEIVDHGRAPYQFNKDNDESYFVTLKTRAGEQVIWGKGLAEAVQERSAGEQVVLQNIGKRDVTVQERLRDGQGHVVGTRPKESQLNAWKSELLSRFSDKARTDFANRSATRQPSFGVYDAKAPSAPEQPAAPSRVPQLQRNAEQQHNARER